MRDKKIIFVVLFWGIFMLSACSSSQVSENVEKKNLGPEEIVYDDSLVEIQTITLPTQFSQIYGGHYFHMRKINNRFVVYKDNAEKYADFSLGDSDISRIGIVNDYIYFVMDVELKDNMLSRYSLKNQRIEIIDAELDDKHVEVFVYKDSIYEISFIDGEITKYNCNGVFEKKYSKKTSNKYEYYSNAGIVDNKLYYILENEKKLNVYSWNFETEESKFVMSCEKDNKKSAYFRYKVFKISHDKLVIAMMFNWDDPWKVYFFGKNGKTEILNNIEDIKVKDNCIYYIDSDFGLYKSDSNLENKKKISEKKFSEFDIVDNRIYAKKYDEWFHDARFDDYEHVEFEYGEEIETVNLE